MLAVWLSKGLRTIHQLLAQQPGTTPLRRHEILAVLAASREEPLPSNVPCTSVPSTRRWNHQHSHQRGQRGHSFSQRAPGWLGLSLGLAATGSLLAAHAEAPEKEHLPTSPTDTVRLFLEEEWQHVRDDVIRQLAQLPTSLPSVSNPLPPTVSTTTDAGGGQGVEIVVPILGGAEGASPELIRSVGLAVRNLLEVSGYTFLSMSSSSEGSRWSTRRASTGSSIEVVCEPRRGKVVIRSEEGFNQSELNALVGVVRAANNLTTATGGGLAPLLLSPLAKLRRQALGLWPSLDEHFQSLERGMQKSGAQWDEELRRAREGWEGQSQKFQEQVDEEIRRFMEAGIAGLLEALSQDREGQDFETEERASNFYEDEINTGDSPRQRKMVPPLTKRPPSLPPSESAEEDPWKTDAARQAAKKLQGMGAMVYPPGNKEKIDWGLLAGYEDQKRSLEDLLLLPLQRPEVYDAVARGTRASYQSNRPRALLLDGPPGTGKTTSARIISTQAALPLVYLPLEAVVSKWYGEAEQRLAGVFQSAEALGGCILFIDELDSLATSRDGDMHEVSRRLLSVLLREMEGFQGAPRCVVIGATNRRQDLDPALLSRFDATVTFPLPDSRSRQLILKQYAQQLTDDELGQLAAKTPGMSGRDLRDVCEITERRWASKIIRGEVKEGALPSLKEYLDSASTRAAEGGAPSFLPNPYANIQTRTSASKKAH